MSGYCKIARNKFYSIKEFKGIFSLGFKIPQWDPNFTSNSYSFLRSQNKSLNAGFAHLAYYEYEKMPFNG